MLWTFTLQWHPVYKPFEIHSLPSVALFPCSFQAYVIHLAMWIFTTPRFTSTFMSSTDDTFNCLLTSLAYQD